MSPSRRLFHNIVEQLPDAFFDGSLDADTLLRRLYTELTGGKALEDRDLKLVRGRLATRQHSVGAGSLADYLLRVKSDPCEYGQLIHHLTIHTTHWFREVATLQALVRVLSELRLEGQKLRGGSVACASGQEVFSLALLLDQHFLPENFELSGHDIDPISVEVARRAVYPVSSLEQIPAELRARLRQGSGPSQGLFTLAPELIDRCRFHVDNALDMAAEFTDFHFIICRNLLIYFDAATTATLLQQLWNRLRPGGVLALGLSETVRPLSGYFESIFPGVYRKISAPTSVAASAGLKKTKIPCLVVDPRLERLARWNNPLLEWVAVAPGERSQRPVAVLGCPYLSESKLGGAAAATLKNLAFVCDHSCEMTRVPSGVSPETCSASVHYRDREALRQLVPPSGAMSPPVIVAASADQTVVVVDDDSDLLQMMAASLSEVAGFRVLPFSRPLEALAQLRSGPVDLLVTDYSMPQMNGTKLIAKARQIFHKLPVVLVSGYATSLRELAPPLHAATLGKPFDPEQLQRVCQDLLAATQFRGVHDLFGDQIPELIALGASTGGPLALEHVLADLGPSRQPVVVVQHLAASFHHNFFTSLAKVAGLDLCVVEHQMELAPGALYAPPPDAHLGILQRGRRLVAAPVGSRLVHGHCPAVDPLFDTIAASVKSRGLGILLTGMGQDGAAGLFKMRAAGHVTVAQDQQSSVVYGMPRAAAELGAATLVADLDQIRKIVTVDAQGRG